MTMKGACETAGSPSSRRPIVSGEHASIEICDYFAGTPRRYLASTFIARSRPASVVGYIRPFISSFMMPIDWR